MRKMVATRVLGIALLGILGVLTNVSDAQWFAPRRAPVRVRQAITVEFMNDSAEPVDVFDREVFKGTSEPGGRLRFKVWDGDVALAALRTNSKTWHNLRRSNPPELQPPLDTRAMPQNNLLGWRLASHQPATHLSPQKEFKNAF